MFHDTYVGTYIRFFLFVSDTTVHKYVYILHSKYFPTQLRGSNSHFNMNHHEHFLYGVTWCNSPTVNSDVVTLLFRGVTLIRLSAPSQFCKLTIPGIHNLLTHSLSTGCVTQNFLKFGEGSLYAICIDFILKCHGKIVEDLSALITQVSGPGLRKKTVIPEICKTSRKCVKCIFSKTCITTFVEHDMYVESHHHRHTHKRLSVV